MNLGRDINIKDKNQRQINVVFLRIAFNNALWVQNKLLEISRCKWRLA